MNASSLSGAGEPPRKPDPVPAPGRAGTGTARLPAVVAAALVILGIGVVGWLLWLLVMFLTGGPDTPPDRRIIQEITVVVPPPPPPPEPEEVIEEEQEVIEPAEDPKVQEDVDTPADEPNDQPAESAEAAGLDKPADVGSDSFHLAAGKGGGLFGRGGGGGGGGDWGGYVETHIRRALQRDPRTRTAQGFLRVAVNIDPSGRFAGAALRSSTGDPRLDGAIRDILSTLPPLGRGRPPRQDGMTNVTINMKRTVG